MRFIRSRRGPLQAGILFKVLLWSAVVDAGWLMSLASAAEPVRPTAIKVGTTPANAELAIYIRPAELAKAKMSTPVVAVFDELLQKAKLGFSVAEIEEFQVMVLGQGNGHEELMIARHSKPYDWKKFYQAQGKLAEEQIDGHQMYSVNGGRQRFALPDDRTVVYGEPGAVLRVLEKPAPNNRADWHDHWNEAIKHPLAGMMRMSMAGRGQNAPGPLATLASDGKYGVMYGEVTDEGLKLTGVIETSSAVAAARVAPAAADALVDFANMIVKEMALPDEANEKLIDQLSNLLGSGELSTRGSSVDVKGLVTPMMLQVFSDSARLARQQKR